MTTVCCDEVVPPLGQVWMVVLRRARPPTGEENHDGMLRSGGASLGQVSMVVRRARPPTGQEDHDGMLRSGGASPRPGVDGGAQGAAP